MNSTQAIVADLAERPTHVVLCVMGNPWLDRVIAIIASVPWAWLAYESYRHPHHLGWPWISLEAQYFLIVLTMVARRPPKRVTPNPFYWLLAFVATYWVFFVRLWIGPGHMLCSVHVSNAVAILGGVIAVWSRLSLGRNIGFVPAQREVVTTGAYRYMRHPIYTGLYVSYVATALHVYSARNVVLFALGCFWFLVKSFVEEGFLKADPQYSAYMKRVRARWIPFVI